MPTSCWHSVSTVDVQEARYVGLACGSTPTLSGWGEHNIGPVMSSMPLDKHNDRNTGI